MIVVFDSGLGGISSLDNLLNRYPDYEFIFYGDRKNAPYGNRSKEDLINIFDICAEKFVEWGASDVLLQCNTMCSTIDFSKYPFKIHDIIDSTVNEMQDFDSDVSVLVVATAATINAGRYQKALKERGYKNVDAYPLKELAGMIERYALDEEISAYLKKELPDKEYDVLILACTHYPLYQHLFIPYGKNIITSQDLEYDFVSKKDKEKAGLKLCLEKDEDLMKFLQLHLHVPFEWYHD